MSQRIDREGTFLAKPLDWSMSPSDRSQSVAMVVQYRILGQFDGDQFVDWSSADVEVYGYHYWVKADGQLNTNTLDMLRKAGLWRGTLAEVRSLPPAVEVRIQVRNESYNGKDTLKVAWVSHCDDDSQPGGIKKLDDAGFRNLEGRFGPMLRALSGAVPKSSPSQAKTTSPRQFQAPPTAPDDGVPPVGESDLPF